MWNDKYAIEEFTNFQKNDFDIIIETGTWKGQGTLFFSQFRDSIITIEIDPIYYITATERFINNGFNYIDRRKLGDIELRVFEKRFEDGKIKRLFSYFGNSIDVLDLILRTDIGHNGKKTKYLFFLDAHWDKNQTPTKEVFPLLEELRLLHKHKFSNAHIIIHDIKNPERPEFEYDTMEYGNGKKLEITIDWIKDDLFKINKNFKLEWNKKSETKRGILHVKP